MLRRTSCTSIDAQTYVRIYQWDAGRRGVLRGYEKSGESFLVYQLEGFEEVNDFRRGNGVFDKVMHAMDLLKQSGQIFGTSICYTSKNIDTVTSDEFLDLIIEKGCRFTWYFHYMPVGNDAAPELLPTKEQREYMYHRIREIRAMEGGKPIYAMDFQNDGEFVGGCIAGGRNYCHINPNGDVERAYSSIIPARISGKSLCWMRSGSPCLWHTGIISHSTAIICGHARCLRIPRS